ncbi:MAG: tyrosine-type recombinase/integrase [Uliginosibacterium sp.]|nr:tyrosine-type recombinase/integrase [Uliginosibacterium sp.]
MAAIRERAGKFQARINRKGFPPQEKTFTCKATAQQWARQVEAAIELGQFKPIDDVSAMTLAEALDKYALDVTPRKRGRDIEQTRITSLKRLSLAKLRLCTIRPADIAKYRDTRLSLVSASTVSKELALLSNLFTIACAEWGADLTNPCTNLKKPKLPPGRDRAFIADEEPRLLSELDKIGRYGDLTRFALATAMRRSELLSLTWQHTDMIRRVAYLALTKNGESRQVPLSPEALAILERLPRPITGGKVFPITVEALKSSWRRALVRACKAYLLECQKSSTQADNRMFADLHFHDMRHIGTTRLAKLIPNTIELSRITGHKTLTMLARYYSTRPEDLAEKLAAKG